MNLRRAFQNVHFWGRCLSMQIGSEAASLDFGTELLLWCFSQRQNSRYEWKDWLSLSQKWKEPVTVDIEGKGESKYF